MSDRTKKRLGKIGKVLLTVVEIIQLISKKD